MSTATSSELRIPADADYIVVAKRAAASFGYIAGFGVEAVDELSIAIAQACENAIRCAAGAGSQPGQIRIVFKLEDRRLEVQVRSNCSAGSVDAALDAPVDAGGRAAVMRTQARADAERRRLAAAHAASAAMRNAALEEARVTDLALRMMGLFVDDCRYRVDERTGGLRVRLTKYRAS